MADHRFKVLHLITRSEPFGGAQRNTWFTVKNAGEMFPPSLACGKGEELPELCREHHIPFYRIKTLKNELNPLDDLRAVYDLWKLFKKEKFDIVHLNSSKVGFLGRIAAKLAGVPITVFTIHGVSFDFDLRPRSAGILLMFEKLMAPMTDGFISVSSSCRDEFIKKGVCSSEQIELIHHAIDYGPIDEASCQPQLKEELGFSKDDFIIGSVGYFRKAKGYEYLVETAQIVNNKIPNAKFAIVGIGPEQDNVQKMINERNLSNVVKILGERNDVPRLLKIFNVFFRPSIHEGLGLALAEAMYAGLPCVVTDVWGSRELISDGDEGILAPVRDSEAMAKAIIELFDSPEKARELGKNARKKIREMLDINIMMDKIEKYYCRLLEKKGLLK